MKPAILTLLFLLMSIFAHGQQVTTHVVKRGETFASIAKKYGISEEKLKKDNVKYKNCYVGSKLTISKPASKATTHSASSAATRSHSSSAHDNNNAVRNLYAKAQAYAGNGKFYKAITVYDQIIKLQPSAVAYYNRGQLKFSNGNYRSSIKDFNIAMYRNDCTDQMKADCKGLIAKAESKREEIHRQNEEAIAGALAVMAKGAASSSTTTTTITTTYVPVLAPPPAYPYPYVPSYPSSTTYPSVPSTTGLGTSGSSSSSSNKNECWNCHGTGKCTSCAGRGQKEYDFGGKWETHDCGICKGTGRCDVCHGRKYI